MDADCPANENRNADHNAIAHSNAAGYCTAGRGDACVERDNDGDVAAATTFTDAVD